MNECKEWAIEWMYKWNFYMKQKKMNVQMRNAWMNKKDNECENNFNKCECIIYECN